MDKQMTNEIENELIKKIEEEATFQFSHSGGHGGQNVNKRETKAELFFDITKCVHMDEGRKSRLVDIAGPSKIHHDGTTLIITNQETRYQEKNKELALKHFKELLLESQFPVQERIPTKTPYRIKEKRLEKKKHHGQKKQRRNTIETDSN